MRFPLALLAFLAVSACSGPSRGRPSDIAAFWKEGAILPAPAASVPTGLGWCRTSKARLAPGDRLTFELEIDRFGETSIHYLEFEVLGPYTGEDMEPLPVPLEGDDHHWSGMVAWPFRVALRLLDETGAESGTTELRIYDSVVQSQSAACAALRELEARDAAGAGDAELAELGGAHQRDFNGAEAALSAMLDLSQEDDLLASLLWDVVEKPSLVSFVTHGGLVLLLTADYSGSSPVSPPVPGALVPGPYDDLPVTISFNGTPALYLDLLVTTPSPPLGLSSGIIAFHGQHPSRDIQVRGRLIEASCRR